jgi:hypothetical protein
MVKLVLIILGAAIVLFISYKIVKSGKDSIDPYDDVAKRQD